MAERKRYQNIRVNAHRKQIYQAVADFKKEFAVDEIIGICGGSENIGQEHAEGIIRGLATSLQNRNVAVLTGGTKGGIPMWGVEIATDYGLPTIGVYPPDGKKYSLKQGLDLAVETMPPSYGDATFGTETAALIALSNAFAIIGGEFGTLGEVAFALKNNNRLIEKGQNPKYICPISDTGGVADGIRNLPSIEKVLACLPNRPVYTGEQAGLFFIEKLSLQPRNKRLVSVG